MSDDSTFNELIDDLIVRPIRETGREIADPGGKRREAEKKQQAAINIEGANRNRLLALSRVQQERTARSKSLAAESARAPKGSARSRRIARNNDAEPASEVLGVEQDFLGL